MGSRKSGTRGRRLARAGGIALGAVLGWAFSAAAAGPATQPAATGRMCCYTNPQYSGVCAVKPAAGETCASIAAYLNDPRSQGKNYCGATSIRGGWKRVSCAARRAATS